MMVAGYDALTAVAVIMLGAGVGTLGSTINPFATVIAANAAGIPFTDGIVLRFVVLILCWLACVAYVMRYAQRIRHDPERSIVADYRTSNEAHFLKDRDASSSADALDFTLTRKFVLVIFALTFAVMIWGVSSAGWWMAEMSGLFLAAAILVGLVARMGEGEFTNSFVDGARGLLGVALIIGIARGIVVVMDAGKMTDTVLFWAESMVGGLPAIGFINMMFGLEVALSFFVPSSSGLAVLTIADHGAAGGFRRRSTRPGGHGLPVGERTREPRCPHVGSGDGRSGARPSAL